MRIAILGAGGVGGYYGGALARAGHPVAMLARGAHLDTLRAAGLEVRTPEGTFTVAVEAAGDPAALGEAELAVVAVKTYSLPEIVPAARLLAERGAIVLPLLNGVDAADRLVEGGVPGSQVLGGLAEISAARIGPGVVERRSPFQRVVLGERAGGGLSERAERIAAVFREAGVEARVSADITLDLWRKLAFIASMAAACGLARSSIGPVRRAPLGPLLIERAVREVAGVARARGVALTAEDEAKILAFANGLPDPMKPSLLLDLESGGPTEIDDLSGAVSRLGRQAGVETPVHDVATAALSVVTSRTDTPACRSAS
jgi:2-dehydropantoate 2-reductase